MKKVLGIGMAGVALAAMLSLTSAGAHEPGASTAADVLPPYEILATIREMGLDPIGGEPARRGFYYVLHAYSPNGTEMRIVADAQFGDILSIVPARALNAAYEPHYVRRPRIIHVPPSRKAATVKSARCIRLKTARPRANKKSAPGHPGRFLFGDPLRR